jgi:hypothetical protein
MEAPASSSSFRPPLGIWAVIALLMFVAYRNFMTAWIMRGSLLDNPDGPIPFDYALSHTFRVIAWISIVNIVLAASTLIILVLRQYRSSIFWAATSLITIFVLGQFVGNWARSFYHINDEASVFRVPLISIALCAVSCGYLLLSPAVNAFYQMNTGEIITARANALWHFFRARDLK